MPALTAAELVTLRDQHPGAARTEWYLAVAPYGDACFTALVNDAGIARGEMTIHYDNETGEANLRDGMTLWVGSTAGAHDIGMIRIRNIVPLGNTISVAENDHIDWADNLFLTCPGAMGFREIWGVYQRMTEAAGVVNFYNDYDTAYNNPVDDILPPKANAGPPVCAWMDANGNADVSFTGDRSYTTEFAAALNPVCAWDFADGVVIAGAANALGTCVNPNVVRFTSPGFRYVSLTVTDNTAQTRTAIVYVPVWIFQDGVEEPFTQVEVLSQQGDLTGWRCKLRVFQTETTSEDIIYNFPPGALVVLFTRTWYGDSETSVGGFCHRENIRFTGWLVGETLKFDYESGFVEFETIGNAKRMSSVPGFSFTLEDDATPSDWYEMDDLNVDRAMHYLLHYHTTVNQVCHVERVGEGLLRRIAIQIFPDASIYSQAQDHLLKDAQCLLLADRQGVLRATTDPQFMTNVNRAGVAIVCDLVDTDWMNDMDESSPHKPRAGLVRLGGFHYATPLLAQAPGDAPRQQENDLRIDGCILQGQAEADLWSGLALTKANNEFPQVPLTLSGYWPVFDPAFQEYVRLTTTDPLGRNVWTEKRFIVRGVSYRDLPSDSTTTTTLVLEAENDIQTGETVTVPVTPPPDPPDDPPGPPDPPPDEPPWVGPIQACVAWTHDQLAYTADLLLHHYHGTATAGTGVLVLNDAAADFIALGVAIGDVVEELGTPPTYGNITTVAAVMSATQLLLTADVGLVATSQYHICGTQWVDILGPIAGTILHFIYVRTGESTLGGWVLTTTGVYYTANIITPSPTWNLRLTIAQATAGSVGASTGTTEFRWIHGLISEPGFVVVSLWHDDTLRPGGAYLGGYAHTHAYGVGAWTYAGMPNQDNRTTAYASLEVSESTGKIWGRRGHDWPPANTSRIYYSVDGGTTFTFYNIAGEGNIADSFHQELYSPYTAGDGTLYLDRWDPWAAGLHRKSVDSGQNFATMVAVVAPGYTPISGKSGATGWVYDANDILMMWEASDDNHMCLLRSRDGGATWVEIGDANDLFGAGEGAYVGTMALIRDTWLPDENELIWVGLQRQTAALNQACRIRYTDDGGTNWYNKMGNWATVFFVTGFWSGATPVFPVDNTHGNVGCTPLPKIGDNE